MDCSDLSDVRARAMKILGSRNLSASEMEKRLIGKGETPDVARDTVEWLESVGAINDGVYAELIVRHYAAKGYGLLRIRDELLRRGIPREMWDDAICGVDEAEMEDAAYGFIEKKLGGSRDKEALQRVTGSLCRRGFSFEDACTLISRFLEAGGAQESSDQ